MYCIKCGVELGDSEKKCPLCGLAVYHPELRQNTDAEPPYPKFVNKNEKVSRFGFMMAVILLFVIPVLLTLVCDISINEKITWSGYAVGGLLLGYIIIVLPIWFNRPNPVIFVPVDFAVVALYLLYIDLSCGGKWFLTLALPLIFAFGAVVTAVVTLMKYVRRGQLYIIGGALIAVGAIMVLMEILINYTFSLERGLIWSFYPLIVLAVLGLMFIVVAICKPLRASLHKKMFI